MMWLFALLGVLVVVVIGLVVVGRETARLAAVPRPAVVDLAEAVEHIADRLPAETQARITHDDVRWVLLADADLLEVATADPTEGPYPWSRRPRPVTGRPLATAAPSPDAELPVVDEDQAVARILAATEAAGRDLADEDVAAILALRLDYLERVGAVGARVEGDGDRPGPA